VVEDVLVVKVDKFTFPINFVMMDMKEDEEVPLILERPFMKTARIIVDVVKGELQLGAQNEEVTFHLFYGLKNFKAEECVQKDATKGVFHLEINRHLLTWRQPNPHFSFMLFCYFCFDFTFQK